MTTSVNLGRNGRIVLGVFAKLHKRAGERLRYDEIFYNLGDAQVARMGQKELSQKRLIIEHPHEAELTQSGYQTILMDFGS